MVPIELVQYPPSGWQTASGFFGSLKSVSMRRFLEIRADGASRMARTQTRVPKQFALSLSAAKIAQCSGHAPQQPSQSRSLARVKHLRNTDLMSLQ
jgi:hypothetical protein